MAYPAIETRRTARGMVARSMDDHKERVTVDWDGSAGDAHRAALDAYITKYPRAAGEYVRGEAGDGMAWAKTAPMNGPIVPVCGTLWTKRGQYNYAIYSEGAVMEAQNGCPLATRDTIVWWYPGKPTLQWGYTGDLAASIRTLEDASC
jgi:hypothetical protein